MKPSISVVLPTWQEARVIPAAIARARAIGDEVVVADAESPDGTAEVARAHGALVVLTEKGRGAQLHAGACAASGDVLLFLHADARLPAHAGRAIAAALADPQVCGGNFHLRFVPETPAARLFTAANHLRRKLFRIYYGDSAIFVRRVDYHRIGGFRSHPILEDYEFVRRLERHGKTAYLREPTVEVSARRFERSPLRTLAVWTALQAFYSAGVPPDRLARLYADVR